MNLLSNTKHVLLLTTLLFLVACQSDQNNKKGQSSGQHDIRYSPEGKSFVITNGNRRFNRALYGSNSGFRVEAGDLPHFALYLPGMGGSFKFGLHQDTASKWLIDAQKITARYEPGVMHYTIQDPMLGEGTAHISVISAYDRKQMIIKSRFEGVPQNTRLIWAYGGITGKQFKRDGDIGADPPSVFHLQPKYCTSNEYVVKDDNTFTVYYGEGRRPTRDERYENNEVPGKAEKEAAEFKRKQSLKGIFPPNAKVKVGDAGQQTTPVALWKADTSERPLITGQKGGLNNDTLFFSIQKEDTSASTMSYQQLETLFTQADQQRQQLANRINLNTPDKYMNTLGGALSVAADAIWEAPAYRHGAVAWRMPLQGWRGAYAGDWLGWHDRSHTHFSNYAQSQYKEPASGPPAPDPETHLARQKEEKGYSLFTRGYISRDPGQIADPHHYDMNQVWIRQLMDHFRWNGDTTFMQNMWPVVNRHLNWEKRCFDPDRNGLYTAYASIWASDALQYSGGGVSYASAYNYDANQKAARLARIKGQNPAPYLKEAAKIKNAVNKQLWLPEKGWYAEYQDLLGHQKTHNYPGLWSIYHLIDNNLPDPFQQYQMLRYVDNHIPHIPLKGERMPEGDFYTLATTRWMPYTWSVNNVALAENLHTALAYWQGNRPQKAFNLWKSNLMESMYRGASPGSFQQLSYYDAMRGELYRDFSDPIGVASRALVEGLFGFKPYAFRDSLVIEPGLPRQWQEASLSTPDFDYQYQEEGNTETYTINPDLKHQLRPYFVLPANGSDIQDITVNGKPVDWTIPENQVNVPKISVKASKADTYQVKITWNNEEPYQLNWDSTLTTGKQLSREIEKGSIVNVYDPQDAFQTNNFTGSSFSGTISGKTGYKTVFIKIKQGILTWWEPCNFKVTQPVEIKAAAQQDSGRLAFRVINHTDSTIEGTLKVNTLKKAYEQGLSLPPLSKEVIRISNQKALVAGSNTIQLVVNEQQFAKQNVTNWNITQEHASWAKVPIEQHFNDSVAQIFENRYLEPRADQPTLQLPWQGMGDWASFDAYMKIDDSGLRQKADNNNQFTMPQGIPFATPGPGSGNNIVYTSLWNNYPDTATIPLSGKASHAYLLMAGSTHHMQSRFDNGVVRVQYQDGTYDSLTLRNPGTWWPIEQDYYEDDHAFAITSPQPYRVHLKTGLVTQAKNFDNYVSIGGFTDYAIDGGAATMLDLPLNPEKSLHSLTLETVANDVVIGLMGITLHKP